MGLGEALQYGTILGKAPLFFLTEDESNLGAAQGETVMQLPGL